jgi:hypothetical protein
VGGDIRTDAPVDAVVDAPLPSEEPRHGLARFDPGPRAVAALLATAAILAALITARASFLSSDASGSWQRALRTEVKRSAAAQEDIRYVYQSELPIYMKVETVRQRAASMREAAAVATGSDRTRLLFEARLYDDVVTALEPASPLSTRPDLALPSGGLDLGKTLADQRNQNPDLVALDPDGEMRTGDQVADRARRVTLATIPVSIGVLFGALAQPFARWRRVFIAVGAVAVGVGATAWALAELLP